MAEGLQQATKLSRAESLRYQITPYSRSTLSNSHYAYPPAAQAISQATFQPSPPPPCRRL
ncbi:MAG: hypothetical protein ACHWZW_01840 [Spirulina sp.]